MPYKFEVIRHIVARRETDYTQAVFLSPLDAKLPWNDETLRNMAVAT